MVKFYLKRFEKILPLISPTIYILLATKEVAFMRVIIFTGVAQSLIKTCHRGENWNCRPSNRFNWNGCMKNILSAIKVTEKILGTSEDKSLDSRIHRHNNKVARYVSRQLISLTFPKYLDMISQIFSLDRSKVP